MDCRLSIFFCFDENIGMASCQDIWTPTGMPGDYIGSEALVFLAEFGLRRQSKFLLKSSVKVYIEEGDNQGIEQCHRCVSFNEILIVIVSAIPFEQGHAIREKRDVMDSMKNAWNEVVKTLSDAGDAVVHVFKPTEKSVVDKVADGIKGLRK